MEKKHKHFTPYKMFFFLFLVRNFLTELPDSSSLLFQKRKSQAALPSYVHYTSGACARSRL